MNKKAPETVCSVDETKGRSEVCIFTDRTFVACTLFADGSGRVEILRDHQPVGIHEFQKEIERRPFGKQGKSDDECGGTTVSYPKDSKPCVAAPERAT